MMPMPTPTNAVMKCKNWLAILLINSKLGVWLLPCRRSVNQHCRMHQHSKDHWPKSLVQPIPILHSYLNRQLICSNPWISWDKSNSSSNVSQCQVLESSYTKSTRRLTTPRPPRLSTSMRNLICSMRSWLPPHTQPLRMVRKLKHTTKWPMMKQNLCTCRDRRKSNKK